MDQEMLARYLARIGAERPPARDAEAVAYLHRQHLEHVPFENLDVHVSGPTPLTEEALLDAIVLRRRGGICYALNGAFAVLLGALGFAVTHHASRVFEAGVPGVPFGHLALSVAVPEPVLVDVGFGNGTITPMPLRAGAMAGEFQLRGAPDGDLDLYVGDRPVYRVEARARALADFTIGNWWHHTSAGSRFTGSLVCSRAVRGGQLTLSGDRLIETRDGVRTERQLAGAAATLAAYREQFGIALSAVPGVRPHRCRD